MQQFTDDYLIDNYINNKEYSFIQKLNNSFSPQFVLKYIRAVFIYFNNNTEAINYYFSNPSDEEMLKAKTFEAFNILENPTSYSISFTAKTQNDD
jgi:hypothetical protein